MSNFNARTVVLIPRNPVGKKYNAAEAERIWNWLDSNGSYNKNFITLMIMQRYPDGILMKKRPDDNWLITQNDEGDFSAIIKGDNINELIKSYDCHEEREISEKEYVASPELQEKYFRPITINFVKTNYDDSFCNLLLLTLKGSATDFIVDTIKWFYPRLLETDNKFYPKKKQKRAISGKKQKKKSYTDIGDVAEEQLDYERPNVSENILEQKDEKTDEPVVLEFNNPKMQSYFEEEIKASIVPEYSQNETPDDGYDHSPRSLT